MKRMMRVWLALVVLMAMSAGMALAEVAELPTLEEVEQANSHAVILSLDNFEQMATQYNVDMDGTGARGDYTGTSVFAEVEDGVRALYWIEEGYTYATYMDMECEKVGDKVYMIVTESDALLAARTMSLTTLRLFQVAEGETLAGATLQEDGLLYATEMAIDDSQKEYFGVTGGHLRNDSLLDPETLLMQSSRIYHVADDGTETLLVTLDMRYDVPFEEPDFAKMCRTGEHTRTMRVVVEPDTEAEAEYVFTAPEGVVFKFFSDRTFTQYADRECTVVMSGVEEDVLPDEVTWYLRYND